MSETLSETLKLIQTFNWFTPSWDLFVLAFWVVASFLFAFAAGRGRVMSVLVSTYIAQLLVIKVPALTHFIGGRLGSTPESLQQLAVFGGLFILLFIFLGRYAFRTSADGRSFTALPFTIVFALLQTGLLINIVLSYMPENVKNSFSQLLKLVFIHQNATFVWMLLPVIFVIFLGRFISSTEE
jgi:hypothetical protein